MKTKSWPPHNLSKLTLLNNISRSSLQVRNTRELSSGLKYRESSETFGQVKNIKPFKPNASNKTCLYHIF